MMYRLLPRGALLAAVLGIALPAPASALTVVAQWNMDNTFGTTMTDISGNANDGATTDVVTSGSGYIFNGSSSKVVVPNSSTLNPGTNDFSFSAQVQTDQIPPIGIDYDLIRKGLSTSTGGEYKLEIVNNRGLGKAKCVVTDSLGNIASERGKTNIADGLLHTLTCIKTATGLTLQVDALPPATQPATLTGSVSNTRPLTIGVKVATVPGDDWYNGTMRSASVSIGP